ncbi:MAG: winged helix-turn-helix transcriptional regulator [Patescibacteria group bacterium]
MISILIFVIGAGIGGIFVWLAVKNPERKPLAEFSEKQAGEKEENKKRILEFISSRDKASNDEIQNFLGVSDASAERYLHELEQEGKIRQIGSTGSGVTYQLKR